MSDMAAEPNVTGLSPKGIAPGGLADISAAPRTRWYAHPHRLIIVCGVVLVAIVIAATASLLLNLRNRDLAEKEQVLENLTLVLAEEIDRSFLAIEFVQTSEVARMKSLGIASAEDFTRQMSGYDTYQRLSTQVGALPYMDAFVLTNAAGKLINFSRSWPAPNVRIPDQDPHEAFNVDTQLTSLVGRPLRSPVTGKWGPDRAQARRPERRILRRADGRYGDAIFRATVPSRCEFAKWHDCDVSPRRHSARPLSP